MNTFLQSLKVMGLGMLGIFIVTIVLIAIMMLLTKLFPAQGKSPETTGNPASEKQGQSDHPSNEVSR